MANYAIFDALKRLFSNDVIIRNVGGNQLKIIDTDRIQSAGNIATNRFADKYSRVFNTASPSMAISPSTSIALIIRDEINCLRRATLRRESWAAWLRGM